MPRVKVFEDRSCVICGNTYEINIKSKREREKKTCSQKCSARLGYLNSRVEVECTICGEPTIVPKNHTLMENYGYYCSDECRKQRYELDCIICEKKFRSDKNTTQVCSTECKVKLARSKIKKVKCECCGLEFERPSFTIPGNKRIFCSIKCGNRQHARENPNRYGSKWSRIRERKVKEDDYTCQECGLRTEEKYGLNVHHKIPIENFENIEDAHFPENLVTLCKTCHDEVHNKKSVST
jgi:HNH endonuclease